MRLDRSVLDEHEVGLLVPEQSQGNAAQRHFLVEDDLVPIVDGHRVCQVVYHLRITTRVCPFSLSQGSPAHVAQRIPVKITI